MHSVITGRFEYGFVARCDTAANAERAYRELLSAAAFDLRICAQSVMAASSLLVRRESVAADGASSILRECRVCAQRTNSISHQAKPPS